MHLVLNLNSIASFLITTQRLLLPQLVSLSIQVIDSSAIARNQFPGARLAILPIISRAYPGLVDLNLRNTESDTHDFVGWSFGSSTLNLPKLQRLVLHSTPASVDWEAINSWNSWTLPSLCHLSVEGPCLRFHGTIWQLLGASLLTLSIHNGLVINSNFWTILPALQELEVTRFSPLDVWCDFTPPALHPIRRVIISRAWPSDPDDEYMYTAGVCLIKFTDQHSPVEWLICDDESINALNQTQWRLYKKTVLSLSGCDTRPEVCEHVMEKWVTGWA